MPIDPQVLDELKAGFAQLSQMTSGTAGAMGALKSGAAALGTLIGGPAGGMIGAALADLPGMIKSLVMMPFDALKDSIMSVKGAFDSVTGAIKPYVAAFAPNTILAFDMAIRDTTAVIGYALVPVLQSCTQIVRSFGDAILPAVRQLEPVFRSVSGVLQGIFQKSLVLLGGFLRGAADALMGFMDALSSELPTFLAMADAFHALVALAQANFVVMAELFNALVKLAPALFGVVSGLPGFGDALRRLAFNAIIAAAALAKLFGLDAAVRQLKRAFGEGQEKGASTGFAAAQNAQVMSITDWSKNLALAAVTAQGTAGESKEDIFQNAVRQALERIDTMDMKQELLKKLDELKTSLVNELERLPAQIAANLKGQVRESLRPPIARILPEGRLPWQ